MKIGFSSLNNQQIKNLTSNLTRNADGKQAITIGEPEDFRTLFAFNNTSNKTIAVTNNRRGESTNVHIAEVFPNGQIIQRYGDRKVLSRSAEEILRQTGNIHLLK